MLRKIKILLAGLILFLVVFGIIKDKIFDTAQNCKKKMGISSSYLSREANIFETPRTLVYRLYFWSIIPMGELKISTKPGDSNTVFTAEADSAKSFVERFIAAKASVESNFSTKGRLPYKYIERTEVNGKIKEKEVIYDREVLLAIQGKKKIRIAKDTIDPLGAFIQMLTLSLEKGKVVVIPFMSGGDLYNFKVTSLNVNEGIEEVLIDIKRANLTSSHGGSLHVWLTNDNSRVPLVFKSWTPVGYASVVLDRIVTDKRGPQ
ncbi:MAG: hypothetical protein AUJ74_06190 [Candidatus Omnitrophica bacterium CG1_02_44_16]|nr:MAG: hypothetical protein AUJ74_06190 [Candidatus Omnitrophica bacterium CG1_02_44_16]PIY83040.1 MAG: hypothetical protein COY78_03630 [Candidatus Omnitrophica bacterium CG_4_10_14_0_8_um_filter_44_12]PIZ83367.1 MAG: hypothetical protein COX96_08050 [Candidatus Omnitrophica bacterium CG_4_10_14_0_2_um_filter_44_9]